MHIGWWLNNVDKMLKFMQSKSFNSFLVYKYSRKQYLLLLVDGDIAVHTLWVLSSMNKEKLINIAQNHKQLMAIRPNGLKCFYIKTD